MKDIERRRLAAPASRRKSLAKSPTRPSRAAGQAVRGEQFFAGVSENLHSILRSKVFLVCRHKIHRSQAPTRSPVTQTYD